MNMIQQAGEYAYTFSRYGEPIAVVQPGETVVVETVDAYAGAITSEKDLPGIALKEQIASGRLNPQTGPIYIQGAQPGDTLVVEILDIHLNRDWAVSALFANSGLLGASNRTPMLTGSLPEQVWIYHRRDDVFQAADHLSFPIAPFLGTIGTAPAAEAISSLTPFRQGGNMDCKDVCAGHTIYLPVEVEGAYFFVGDCHVNQGDGEICSVALEISAQATLCFGLRKAAPIGWPRIESETEYMTVGSMRPLEDAARIACREMIDWLLELQWEKTEAYQLLSQACRMYVANVCNPMYSVVVKIDKERANFFCKYKN